MIMESVAVGERPIVEYSRWQRGVATATALVMGALTGVAGVERPAQAANIVPHPSDRTAAAPYIDPRREFRDNGLPPQNLRKAPPVDAGALEQVKLLLARPVDPLATDEARGARLDKYLTGRNIDDYWGMAVTQTNFEMRQQLAERYGLHVFDPTKTLEILFTDAAKPKGEQMPIADYVAHASSYLANFDISMGLAPTDKEGYPYDLSPASLKDLDSTETRLYIADLIDDMAQFPREYIDLAGVKRFLLTKADPDKPTNVLAYVMPQEGTTEFDAVVLNTSLGSGYGVLGHEVWHKIHGRLTGGYGAMHNDAAMAPFMSGAHYTQDHRPLITTGLTRSEFFDKAFDLAHTVRESVGLTNCDQIADDATQTIRRLGATTVFYTAYSRTNEAEQQAELGEAVPNGTSYPSVLDPNTPLIAEQFTTQLARLYAAAPPLAQFFIAQQVKFVDRYNFANLAQRCHPLDRKLSGI